MVPAGPLVGAGALCPSSLTCDPHTVASTACDGTGGMTWQGTGGLPSWYLPPPSLLCHTFEQLQSKL